MSGAENTSSRRTLPRTGNESGLVGLRFILHYFGKKPGPSMLEARVHLGERRWTSEVMAEVAVTFSCSAKVLRHSASEIGTMPLPALVSFGGPEDLPSWIVLLSVRKNFVRVFNCTTSRKETWSRCKWVDAHPEDIVLIAPIAPSELGDRSASPLRRLVTLTDPHRSVMIQALVGAVISTILALSSSIYIQKIIDTVIPDSNYALLNLLGVSMLAVTLLRLMLGMFQSYLSLRTSQMIDASLIIGYYRHLLHLPQHFFDTIRVGEMTSRISDAVKIRNFLNSAVINLVLNPLILVFALTAMFFYSPAMAGLSAALVVGNFVIYFFVNLRNRKYQRVIMERTADFDAQLVESLQSQLFLRRFNLHEKAVGSLEIRLVTLMKAGYRAALVGIKCGTAGTALTQIYQVVLLWTGARLVLGSQLTAGQLMSCYALAGYLSTPLNSLIGLNTSIQEALIATDRLFEVMDREREADSGSIHFLPRHAGDICIENVSFSYPGRPETLKDISAVLSRGKITALAGKSGSGKSTLLSLLQRIYTPNRGRITIGDIDIRDFSLNSLRQHLAGVPQSTTLLTGTVLENIAPGAQNPDLEHILGLCDEVGLRDFIETLPSRHLTKLSEGGANLSGGQRQRLAVVRAAYGNPPLLLLDEPTASLDHEAEGKVLALLEKLRDRGVTIVVAAHHQRVLQVADSVLHLENGVIMGKQKRAA